MALVTKGNKLRNNTKNTTLAVAYLFENNITDCTSESLAEAVASKVLNCIGGAIDHLSSLSKFGAAASTAQAKTTIALKNVFACHNPLPDLQTSFQATPLPWSSLLDSPQLFFTHGAHHSYLQCFPGKLQQPSDKPQHNSCGPPQLLLSSTRPPSLSDISSDPGTQC
ncbi:hypothetical protein H2248_009980 [Termitomyces sp. 'cryptogamus']|nr:hypothetical protein H2248_009980 [Termitomyces sp. 'cryptogamus']